MDYYGLIKFAGFAALVFFAIFGERRARDRYIKQFKQRPLAYGLGLVPTLGLLALALYTVAYPQVVPSFVTDAIMVSTVVLLIAFFIWARKRTRHVKELDERVRARDSLLVEEAHVEFIETRKPK